MAEYTVERIEVIPYLDIELLMSLSQETRIGGDEMNRMVERWERWASKLRVRRLKIGKIQYVAAWLTEEVEQDVDSVWDESPSEAYLVNNLAQLMVMSAIHKVLPEVEDAGCAPAPKPIDGLVDAMEEEGCPYHGNGQTLQRRYAVITHFPFKGACDICYLKEDCPKGSGSGESQSILLGGFEQG